jgi:hypothetical protein
MAEDHRRVEPRNIVGTGMATDPERLEQISDEAQRRERASRAAPEQSFGAVLQTAPAKATLADAVVPDPRKAAPAADGEDADGRDGDDGEAQKKKKPASSKPLPSLPDPRERLLRQRLAALEGVAQKMPSLSTETPPNGNSRMNK